MRLQRLSQKIGAKISPSNRLQRKIAEIIRAEGPVSFERFMEMALYYPGLGYYARDAGVIGTEGDFYTSPHVHPIFGAAIARQLEEMAGVLDIDRKSEAGQRSSPDDPARFRVVEMGAGAGRLARDILDYLAGEDLYCRIAYTIIESNLSYERGQREILAGHPGKVAWVPSLEELPPFSGCFLTNELVDALPVRLIEIAGADIREIRVNVDEDDRFSEVKREAGEEIAAYVKQFAPQILEDAEPLENHPDTYRTEVNLKAREWLAAVAGRLESGFVLTIDYGFPAGEYYQPFRNAGTLMAYREHQAVDDPYGDVGLQDLTAHVNFSALSAWGAGLGLVTCGFTSQGPFLASLGIEELLGRFAGSPPDPMETARIRNLIMPQGLGETHKVLVQRRVNAGWPNGASGGHCGDSNLAGFNLRNEMRRL